jgi:hypothetical protein
MHSAAKREARARFAQCVSFVVAMSAARYCFADTPTNPPDSNAGRAEQLFHEGVQKFDSGQTEEACRAFANSLKFDPELGTLLNLALCHEKLGRTATAWSEFTHGAAWATQNGQTDRRAFANDHAIRLEARLSRVLIALPPSRALGAIEVDGEPLPEPRWFLPLFLDPGVHTIAASGPGKLRRAETLHVPEGPSTQTFQIKPLDDVPRGLFAIRIVDGQPSSSFRARTILGVASLGFGAVGIGLGAVFGVTAIAKRNDIGASCVDTRCTPSGVQTSTIAFASGAGFALIGAWLMIGPGASTSASNTPRIRVAPSFFAGGGALHVTGAW